MSPGAKLLRRMLFLNVEEAVRREQAAHETAATIRREETRLNEAKDRLVKGSSELRSMFDDLMGKL